MEIMQCPVELPDGNIVMTKKKGDDLTSRTVIGAGERRDGGLFYFQEDLTSRTVIGAGERRDGGLFYFQEVPTTRVFKTTTTIATVPFDLCHKR
nr:hypothetical protein [Tanacetum cinerariifolium]